MYPFGIWKSSPSATRDKPIIIRKLRARILKEGCLWMKSAMDFEATAIEPSGHVRKFWCKVAIQDRDHNTYEMWTAAPNGRKFRMMLCEYTRV